MFHFPWILCPDSFKNAHLCSTCLNLCLTGHEWLPFLQIKMLFNMVFVSLVWPWPVSSGSFSVLPDSLYASKHRATFSSFPHGIQYPIIGPSDWNNSYLFWLTPPTRLSSGRTVGKVKKTGVCSRSWEHQTKLKRLMRSVWKGELLHPIGSGHMLLFPKAAIINSHKFSRWNIIREVSYTSGGEKPNTGFTGLTARFLQAVFLSEGSVHILAHSGCWQNPVPSGWRTIGLLFLWLSDEGHSQVLEATHIPWLVALRPHLQS